MLWLTLSLLTALAVASQDAWVKKHFSHLTAYDMVAFPSLFGLPLFAVALPFVPVPPLDATFYRYFLISLPLNVFPFFTVLSFVSVMVLLVLGKIRLRTFRDDWLKGMVAGLLFFVHALAHGFAICMVKASYMISVKRLSALIDIVYGRLFFKEKYMTVRLAGAGLMVAGAVLITLWGK